MKRILFFALLLASCAGHKTALISQATKVNLDNIERFTLANGLEVILVPRKTVPSVQVTLAIKAGEDNDPIDKSGLAEFTAEMLRKGTKTRTAAEIAETIDFVGAVFGVSTSDEATFVGCQARSQDLKVCLDVLSDVVQNPSFPESEMGLLRQQFAASIEQVKDSPGSLAGLHAANVFYGDDDSRGRPPSHLSLSKIKRDTLVDFHKKWYAPNNAILAVSGDFDAAMVKSAFASWIKREVPKAPEFPKIPVGALKVRVVDKPDATQSNIVLVGPGIAHSDADFYAVVLMNYTLGGGGFSSRLVKVVRSEGGKTYGASSSFQAGRDQGIFSVSTFTRNAETGATLQLVMGELEKMRKSGVTSEELVAAKGKVVGGFGLRLETGSDLANRLLAATIDGLLPDYLVKYPERMTAVTAAQASKAAADHLFPTTLVVVGNAKEVVPQLEKLGLAPQEVVHYQAPVSKSER